MVDRRLKSWLMSGALAFSATLATFYVAIVVQSLMQPQPRPGPSQAEPDLRANDRDWNHVNDWWPSLKDLYTMTAVATPTRSTDDGATDSAEQEQWRKFSETCASASLKTLTPAEPDFRANDRDWCHVNDFWTTDVTGLYKMASAADEPRKAEAVRYLTCGYWDGIGLWHGDLWMLHRLLADAQVDPAIKLIELSIQSADSPEK